jgi:hypothetical protein
MNTANNRRAGVQAVSELDEAAAQLAAIAGAEDCYIIMPPTGPNKYVWVHGALTAKIVRKHLEGTGPIVGAELRQRNGYTQALAFDVDTAAGWDTLNAAARALAASGARPLLVRSPAGRGGHLWLLFDQPVSACLAFYAAYHRAPMLTAILEYWPRDSRLAVRLPGGFYRSAARGQPVAAWCPVALIAADVPPAYVTGADVAHLLLLARTPHSWAESQPQAVPQATATSRPVPGSPPRRLLSTTTAPSASAEHPVMMRSLPPAAADPYWQARHIHDRHTLWFWITDRDAVTWFNSRTTARDLLPPADNGYGLARWRNERTASVGYRPDGGWVDHGAGGRRADGQPDGGDPLDLYCRVEHIDRPQALRRIVRNMVAQARAELEAAARAGRHPAPWVCRICSPAGWARYDALRLTTAAPEPSESHQEAKS